MSYCAHCGAQVPAGAVFCPACGKPPSGRPLPRLKGPPGGVILWVGVALVPVAVAVIGIIAAILIPNFLDALQKAKQKRTVADLRAIGAALEGYRADHGAYPLLAGGGTAAGAASLRAPALQAALVPAYAPSLAAVDAWKRPWHYTCLDHAEAGGDCARFRLASGGRDGILEQQDLAAYTNQTFAVTDYDRDIVLGPGGDFVQCPAGRGR